MRILQSGAGMSVRRNVTDNEGVIVDCLANFSGEDEEGWHFGRWRLGVDVSDGWEN